MMRVRREHDWATSRSFAISISLILVTIPSSGTAAPVSLQSIAAAYQGSWKAHFVGVSTPYSTASVTDERITNDCRTTTSEALCMQSVDGKPTAELHFVATSRSGWFGIRTFAPGQAAAAGSLFVARNQWIYPWHEHHAGHETMFRVVNRFIAPDRIEFSREYRAPNGAWRQMAFGHEDRDAAPQQSGIPVAAPVLPAAGVYRIGAKGKLYLAPMIDENGRTVQFLTPTGEIGRAHPVPDGTFSDSSTCPNRFSFSDHDRKIAWSTCKTTHRGIRQTVLAEQRLTMKASDGTTIGASVYSANGQARRGIVLTHGADSETREMGVIVPLLAEAGFKVMAFDQRGSGQSPGDWRSAGIRQIGDDAARLADSLHHLGGTCSVGFYGFSNGGWIAPAAAALYRQPAFLVIKSGDSGTVAANVEYETFAAVNKAFGPKDAEVARSVMARLMVALASDQPADWGSARAALESVAGAPWFGVTQLPKPTQLPLDEPTKAAYRRQLMFDPADDWRSLRAPVLVLLGAQDLDVDARASAAGFRSLFATHPGLLTMTIFPNAGHQLVIGPGDAANSSMTTGHVAPGFPDAMTAWLARVPGRPRASQGSNCAPINGRPGKIAAE